ncbi:EcsC family protein [Butyrivibrio sp. XPD2002]|uniref:EcsC family protein n=1 Tax=Butyrivibrio sp. XPD2002 TaxID=1280665 RepID=UPI000406D47A|nr:EcsC family protein [Butyrivibrio sp. XPD2002]
MEEKQYVVPKPVINKKEEESLTALTERYEKMNKPGKLSKAGKKIAEVIPKSVKEAGKAVKETITEAELFVQCMKVVAEGFSILEKQAAKMTISEDAIVQKVDATTKKNEITCLEEICLARGYNISKIVAKYKTKDLGLALVEGGTTGAFGFAGLPFNLVLSTFIYYRAVQSIAMFYGYDVKNDSAELMIAGDVFMNVLSPKCKGSNEVSSIIGKIMVMTETTAIKQTAKKTWSDMAARGGVGLLLTQMRALANKSAQKALEKAGQKGLEESVFKGVFEQIGKNLTKKAIGKAVPVVGAVIGGLFDTAQMNTVIDYADIFYNKRYLLEKDVRIHKLIEGDSDEIIDISPEDIAEVNLEQ